MAPRLTLVPKVAVAVQQETRKQFSFDIIQIDAKSGMMTIDACIPAPVVMQLLKLLEPYA